MTNSEGLENVYKDMLALQITKEEKIEQFDAIISNQVEYQFQVADSILEQLKTNAAEKDINIDVWNVPEWPREELDNLVILFKESFLKKLKDNIFIKDYEIKSESRGGGKITDFELNYEIITATIYIRQPINALVEYLEQVKNDINKSGRVLYRIKYTKDRRVLLNEDFQLAKANFESENDQFFEFVYKNSLNGKIFIEELTKRGIVIKKRIPNILNDLGFRNELRKLFFHNVSKKSLLFTNPITEDSFNDLNIDRKKLITQIEGLERVESKK